MLSGVDAVCAVVKVIERGQRASCRHYPEKHARVVGAVHVAAPGPVEVPVGSLDERGETVISQTLKEAVQGR